MPFWGDPEKPPPPSSLMVGSTTPAAATAKEWSRLTSDWLLSVLPEEEAEREVAAQVRSEAKRR